MLAVSDPILDITSNRSERNDAFPQRYKSQEWRFRFMFNVRCFNYLAIRSII